MARRPAKEHSAQQRARESARGLKRKLILVPVDREQDLERIADYMVTEHLNASVQDDTP